VGKGRLKLFSPIALPGQVDLVVPAPEEVQIRTAETALGAIDLHPGYFRFKAL
jgi:hypothetical protein